MQHLKKEEPVRKRRGRKRKEKPIVVREVEDAVEVSPGKYEVLPPPGGEKLPELIPPGMSPVEYIEKKQRAIIDRVEGIACSGRLEDAVKLKANLALLNKVLPDIQKSEVTVTISPYQRILNALEGKNDE
jgi:hypothetical protein